MEIPENHFGLLVNRSSIGKKGLYATGIIDSDYRNEVKIPIWNSNPYAVSVNKANEALAQLLIVPYIQAEMVEVTKLNKWIKCSWSNMEYQNIYSLRNPSNLI